MIYDIKDKLPEKECLFMYNDSWHHGYLYSSSSSRPIKWVWYCHCCGLLNMEELEYGEESPSPIHLWAKLPRKRYDR
jgi:hypothetical protein